ncbi:MAG: T9SS type A sorting domain-containing protein [Chitinophagaceae bacterium]|nr:T9SS type A sorting domain-containing protein [Chitinophagaceae bacterium]
MKKFFTSPVVKLCSLLFFFSLTTQQIAAQTFYYKGTGALNSTTSWGANTDGTGVEPVDFVTASQTFIIQNTTSIVFNSGTWLVSGAGTKVHLGNPTTATPNTPSPAITLTIAAGNTINTSGQLFDVAIPSSGNHKIIYQNTTPISVGTINDANLEIVYDGAVFATSTSRVYGNVSLINGANIDISGATNGPTFSNLTVEAGCTLTGPVGGSNTWIGIKAGGVVTINGIFKAGRSGGLFTANVAFPVVNSTSNGTLLFNSATVTQGSNLILGPNSTIDYYRGTTGQVGVQTVQALNYANLIFSNLAVASNKTWGAGTSTVSGTFTVSLLGTITTPTTQNITLKPGARLMITTATTFPAPTGSGKFTLESNGTATASIGTLATGASITGNVTVQQFIPGGFRKYRFLSHPFNTTQALSQITDNIDITGNTAGTSGQIGQTVGAGFSATPTNNPSAFFFNTSNANGNGTNDGGWSAFTDATTSSWGVGQGIRVLIRGTKGQTGTLNGTNNNPDPVTLDMAGVLNTGAVNVNLVTGGSGSTSGFNFVGNPYASPVDIGAVLTASAANLGSSFYLRNPQTGSYITVNPIPASYIIPAYTSFFVQATSATTLNFTEANKNVCSSCPTVFRSAANQQSIQLKVLFNGVEYDRYTLNVDKNYTNNFNRKDDAIKLMNDGLNIYSLSTDLEKLAADYRNIESDSIIPLGITIPANFGKLTYTIEVAEFSVSAGTKIILHDKWKNTFTELTKDLSISLEVDATNPNSVGNNRLALIYKKPSPVNTINTLTDVTIATAKNQFVVKYENALAQKTSIKIVNVAGQVMKNFDLGNQTSVQKNITNTDLADGLYIIEVEIGKEKTVRKIIK